MGKTRINNSNALIDFFARNKKLAEDCSCEDCLEALRCYKDFHLGRGGRREAISFAKVLVEKHGWS